MQRFYSAGGYRVMLFAWAERCFRVREATRLALLSKHGGSWTDAELAGLVNDGTGPDPTRPRLGKVWETSGKMGTRRRRG
jgi:hypothetical protein